ncbi:ATP-binding protein [Nitrincola tapanii]|uniref:histidine kinase n=1 Tax=Nitrincola tapanii TaxID=1708751 RepID=A0A5A9W2H1_9GAMM|nr:ATP-binding protein [Nitrincola tapanii]KAA0874318.1 PAS domain S-box protein [Nitrincola tapanii]
MLKSGLAQLDPSGRHVLGLLLAVWSLLMGALLWQYFASVRLHEQQSLTRIETATQALALTQGELVSARLAEIDRSLLTLRDLIQHPSHSELREEHVRRVMLSRRSVSAELLDYLWLDKTGRIQNWTQPGPPPWVADRHYFTQHRDDPQDRSLISPPAFSRVDRPRLFIALSRPLYDAQGEFDGVLIAAIDVRTLAQELGRITEDSRMTTALLTLPGELIYRMPMIDLRPGMHIERVAALQGQIPETYAYRSAAPIDGRMRQVAYQRLQAWPLLVVVTEDLEDELLQLKRFARSEQFRFGFFGLFASALIAVLFVLLLYQQRVARARREQQQRLEEVQKLAQLGHWRADMKTGALWWSDEIYTIFGWSKSIQPSVEKFKQAVHPDDRALVEASEQLAQKEGRHDVEHRILRPNGEVRWVHERAKARVSPQGELLELRGSVQDITDLKQTEERLRQQALALQKSNDELEQFAYVASHDLRQPLRMINSFSELLNQRLQAQMDQESREYMEYVLDGSQRLDEMLISLLEYSRVGRSGEPEQWIQSRVLLEEALRFLQPEIQATQAQIHLVGDWPKLKIARNEGVRLFQNLLANALKFHAAGRVPEIELKVEALSQGWQFSICDQGIGIDATQLERVFLVFQRLNARGAYPGSGIGLPVCRKIVERHGGIIWAESAGINQGSCFKFILPRLSEGEQLC